jgi:hypothetical protein
MFVARKRSIQPGYVESAAIEKLSFTARYLDQNLWCHLDGNGMIEESISLIKAKVFPRDGDKLSTGDVTRLVQELVDNRRIFRLTVDGKPWLFRKDFRKEQRIYKDEPRKCQPVQSVLDDIDKGNTLPQFTGCNLPLFPAETCRELPTDVPSASSSPSTFTSTSPSSDFLSTNPKPEIEREPPPPGMIAGLIQKFRARSHMPQEAS